MSTSLQRDWQEARNKVILNFVRERADKAFGTILEELGSELGESVVEDAFMAMSPSELGVRGKKKRSSKRKAKPARGAHKVTKKDYETIKRELGALESDGPWTMAELVDRLECPAATLRSVIAELDWVEKRGQARGTTYHIVRDEDDDYEDVDDDEDVDDEDVDDDEDDEDNAA